MHRFLALRLLFLAHAEVLSSAANSEVVGRRWGGNEFIKREQNDEAKELTERARNNLRGQN